MKDDWHNKFINIYQTTYSNLRTLIIHLFSETPVTQIQHSYTPNHKSDLNKIHSCDPGNQNVSQRRDYTKCIVDEGDFNEDLFQLDGDQVVTVVQPDPHREVVVENVFIVYTAAEARAEVGDVTAGV